MFTSLFSMKTKPVPVLEPELITTEPLEQVIEKLCKFGRPYIHCHTDMTWSCSIDLNSDVVGGSFSIKSGFKHKTAKEAAYTVLMRIHALGKELLNANP